MDSMSSGCFIWKLCETDMRAESGEEFGLDPFDPGLRPRIIRVFDITSPFCFWPFCFCTRDDFFGGFSDFFGGTWLHAGRGERADFARTRFVDLVDRVVSGISKTPFIFGFWRDTNFARFSVVTGADETRMLDSNSASM